MAWLESRAIDRMEAAMRADLGYLRDVLRSSRGAFWKLALFGPLAAHRRHAPSAAVHLARVGAVQAEDCGPCVQIAVDAARRDGVPAAVLRDALAGGAALEPALADAYLFGREISTGAVDEARRQRLLAALGERAVTELAVAAATVRVFPALKRGLGRARSCALAPVEVT